MTALPSVRLGARTFATYANASMQAIFGPSLAHVQHLEAATLDHVVFFNRGGRFEAVPLPAEAQFAPAFYAGVADFDGDGHEDLFLSQNFYPTEIGTPRYDAGRGLLLRNRGDGSPEPVPGQVSGITVYGDQRGAAFADYDGDGRVDLVVSQNGAETKLYHNEHARPRVRVRLVGGPGNPHGIGAALRVVYEGGSRGPVREVHGGSGYWSEDGAVQVLGVEQGTITGQVTDQTSGQPLVGARVSVVGTSLVPMPRAEGRYRIANVPPGQVTVRASFIGYAAGSQSVSVAPGDAATADLALVLTPYSLDEVVVTATGEQAKREVPNVTNAFRAESLLQTGTIGNMNDLLAARAPGLEVLQGNLTGAGARVRIRGTNSLSLNNELLYIIDGVRMTSANNSSSIGIGGTNPSRIPDSNPEQLASLEVLKGPSAAALYGTAASTVVIVITTKRGPPGPTRWNVYAEQGLIKDYNTYPTAYRGWKTHPSGIPDSGSLPTNGIECLLTQTARAPTDPQFCLQDSVTTYNLFDDPQTSPNATGYRNQYGVQVQGGSDVTRYFVSGEWENEVSQLKMPPFAVDSVLAIRPISEVPFQQLRPNARRRVSVRANAEARLNPRMDLSGSSGFISSTQRLPQTDNNTTGLLSNALGGLGNKADGKYGYRAFTPDEMLSETVTQDINRFIGSGTLNWRPTSWLAVRATGGIDFTHRLDTGPCRRNECTSFGTTKRGFKTDNRTNFFSYTGEANATATFQLSPQLSSRTSVGAQYLKDVFDRNGASGSDLPPGATTVGAGAIQRVSEATDITKTVGGYVEQLFGYKDRLFVTGALRVDDNSAFGANFQAVFYPKFGVSYVISEEPYFPKWTWINSVRLRGAVGASGVQPGTTDALRFFAPTAASVDNADSPAILDSASGNPGLKPERAREYEIGGEAVLFEHRVSIDLTYYNKRTKDALIARIIPPSAGASDTRFENLRAVANRGLEGLVTAPEEDRQQFGWDP